MQHPAHVKTVLTAVASSLAIALPAFPRDARPDLPQDAFDAFQAKIAVT